MAKSKGRSMRGGDFGANPQKAPVWEPEFIVWLNQRYFACGGVFVRNAHNSAPFRHLDLIEYSLLHYAVTQTNISYRQSCILCEMHLKFNRAES